MKIKAQSFAAVIIPLGIALGMANLASWRPRRIRVSGAPFQVTFAPDGRHLALASQANSAFANNGIGRVEWWEFAAPSRFGAPNVGRHFGFAVHNPSSICFSGDSQTLVGTSYGDFTDNRKTIRRWNAQNGESFAPVTSAKGDTAQFAHSAPNGADEVSFWTGEAIEKREIKSGEIAARTPLHNPKDDEINPDSTSILAFSPDGRTTVWPLTNSAGTNGGALIVRDASSKKTRLPALIPPSDARSCEVTALTFSPDSQKLAVAWNDQKFNPNGDDFSTSKVTIWNLKTRKISAQWSEIHETINAHAFSPDGKILAAARADGAISLRESKGGKLIRALKTPGKNVSSVAFAPDGSTLASCGSDGALYLWRIH